MKKIKWYDKINPLFWLELYVSQALYNSLMKTCKNITDNIIREKR